MREDVRTLDRIEFHYRVERRLADKLRNAPPSERVALYAEVYDDLFNTVEDLEQLQIRGIPELARRETARQFAILALQLRSGFDVGFSRSRLMGSPPN